MIFFDLRQTGTQVQELLDSLSINNDLVNSLKNSVENLPIVVINEDCDLNTKLVKNCIYLIPKLKVNQTTVDLERLHIVSDYIFVINLYSVINNKKYSSQCMLAQNNSKNFAVYIRDIDDNGNWTEFKNFEDTLCEKAITTITVF